MPLRQALYYSVTLRMQMGRMKNGADFYIRAVAPLTPERTVTHKSHGELW
jgi:hypothetical protein